METIPEPIPKILTRHVPNVYFDKSTGRRGEMFAINIADDSNIHYENIFPQILSKNTKHSANVSLERMPIRKTEFVSAGAEKQPTFYDRKYTLVERKVVVPLMAGQKSNVQFPSVATSPRLALNEEKQLQDLEKLPMKRKLQKLDSFIAFKGEELKIKLAPNGQPY